MGIEINLLEKYPKTKRDIIWMLIFALIVIILAVIPKKNYLTGFKGFILFSMYLYFIYIAFL